jgi:hypothetical protein
MSVDAVAARVTQVLARAESLFAVPADAGGAISVRGIGEALDAGHAISAVSEDLLGAAAGAHREAIGAATERLGGAAGADDALVSQLVDAGRDHHAGRSDASALRAGAAEVPTAVDALGALPAAEVVALTALRNRVAAMHDLITRHVEDAGRAAAAIRDLGYR